MRLFCRQLSLLLSDKQGFCCLPHFIGTKEVFFKIIFIREKSINSSLTKQTCDYDKNFHGNLLSKRFLEKEVTKDSIFHWRKSKYLTKTSEAPSTKFWKQDEQNCPQKENKTISQKIPLKYKRFDQICTKFPKLIRTYFSRENFKIS